MSKVIVWGEPQRPVEQLFAGSEFVYVDRLDELTGDNQGDDDYLAQWLIHEMAKDDVLYIATFPTIEERFALDAVQERKPIQIADDRFELLQAQLSGPCNNPVEFETAYEQALDNAGARGRILFSNSDDPDVCTFHTPLRRAKPHTVRWCHDGTVEINGNVLRHAALMGYGFYTADLLGGDVLTPSEIAGFVASRLATTKPDELLSYGRAFGPGKDDHTNATLTPRARKFRSEAVVGVINVFANSISKAKFDTVSNVAKKLHAKNPTEPVFLHQQCLEIYQGQAAVDAFRGDVTTDEKGRTIVELHGKSTKHTRVDAGAYCLYTESGDGYITIPVVVGQFEESNAGGVFAPKSLMDELLKGYLHETVVASKDHASMTPELVRTYYDAVVNVEEGDRIEPDQLLFTVGDIPHTWETKADYGIVRKVNNEATRQLVRVSIEIDAWFCGDAKLRGPIKAMTVPLEAAGMTIEVDYGPENPTTRDMDFVIGAPGVIKDSAAWAEYFTEQMTVFATLTTTYCRRDYERAKTKHGPLTEAFPGIWRRDYGDVTLTFRDDDKTVCTMDPGARAGYLKVMIEASPVGQSVGSSSMTLPQIAWMSSPELPTCSDWLKKHFLPGAKRRARALQYLHAVAANCDVEL